MRWDFLRFFLGGSGAGDKTISGAEVAEDSPRSTEKPLLECSFCVDGAETELRWVPAASEDAPPCEDRRLGILGAAGILRMS